MDFKILTAANYKKTEWSGGATTELYIHPPNEEFKANNYYFRLSIATVEMEESIFTKLEGVARTLMILEGQVTLSHNGHYESKLEKFDSDHFSGEWLTKCIGTCTDFNLMTKGKTKGSVTPIIKKGSFEAQLFSSNQFTFFYIQKGEVLAKIKEQDFRLEKENLLVIQSPVNNQISFLSNNTSEIVRIDIQ